MNNHPQMFAVLSHPRRLRILRALRGGPLTVWKLRERLGRGVSRGAMREYLHALEGAGLVWRTRSVHGDEWRLKKDALRGAIICLTQLANAADQELPSFAFAERSRHMLKNKKLLHNESRQRILIEILRGPSDVAGIYKGLKGAVSKKNIYHALSAFECEGLVSSRKISRQKERGTSCALEFTATHLAQEVLDYSQAEITAGGGV